MISPNAHLLGDYLLGALLVLAGSVTPLAGSGPGVVLLVLGVAELGLAGVTRWKWSVFAALPVRIHAGTDLVAGVAVTGLGLVLWLTASDTSWLWIVAVGIAMLVMLQFTSWSASAADGSSARSPDYVQDASGVRAGRYEGTAGPHSSATPESSPDAHDDAESPREWPDPARPDEAESRRSRSA